jgi:hypothetical protein
MAVLIWQDYALTSEAAARARPQSSCINLSGAVGQLWTCTERDLEHSHGMTHGTWYESVQERAFVATPATIP